MDILKWLTEDDNPAVKYRTQTELIGEPSDKAPVIEWVENYLPSDWAEFEGVWSTYYLNAFAECGLCFDDVPLDLDKERAMRFESNYGFEYGCNDFMRLRALVRLGLADEPAIVEIMNSLSKRQLPDGGFLCLHRIDKLRRIPKSCVKSNIHALMLCAECKKKGIEVSILEPLLDYFWKHNIFYRTDNPEELILNVREGWRNIDTFYPFEVMRVGLQNIVEAFCALGLGNDDRLSEAWSMLESKKNSDGQVILNGTLSKSYLPKERVNKPGKWATFYTLLAEKERKEKR